MFKKIIGNKKTTSKQYDVIIHIGAPKAGSSAIQRFCVNNQETLAKLGFYYPNHSLDSNSVSGGHQGVLARHLISNELQTAQTIYSGLLAEAKRRGSTLLLSAEGFYGQSEKFRSLLSGQRYLIVGWLRPPFAAFVSNYNQGVKRHFSKRRFLDVCRQQATCDALPHYSGQYLLDWVDALGGHNCRFLPYLETYRTGGGSIERVWLEMLGCSTRDYKRFQFSSSRVNTSYPQEALELRRLLNHVLDESDGLLSQEIDKALQQYSDISAGFDAPVYVGVDGQSISKLSRLFSACSDRLINEFPAFDEQTFWDAPSSGELKPDGVGVDLTVPLKWLWEQLSDEMRVIEHRVASKLSDTASNDYAVMRLAELFVLPFKEPVTAEQVMPDWRLKRLLAAETKEADFLREFASIMETMGDNAAALALIQRAHELRPTGPAILSIRERLLSLSKCGDKS